MPNDAGGDADDAKAEQPAVPSLQAPPGLYQYRRNESNAVDAAVLTGGERYTLKLGATVIPVVTPYLSVIPASVETVGPCWRLRMDFIPADPKKGHVERMMFCPSGGRLLVSSDWNTQQVTLDFNFAVQNVLTTITCASTDTLIPAALLPGAMPPHSCAGKTDIGLSFDDPATATFLGSEQVPLVSGAVPGYHVRLARKPSGSGLDSLNRKNQLSGAEDTDLWFDPTRGTVLRLRRRIDTTTVVAVPNLGDVETRYEEASDWLIDSLTPAPAPDAGASDAASDATTDGPADAPKDAPADAPKG